MINIYDDVERDDLLLNHICWVLVVTYFKKQKNCGDEWWEPGVWRSQRDLPCYPLLPFVHGVGLGEVCPAHSVFSLSLLDRDPRNVCNAWKKKSSLFLRRYYWCTFMSSATNASECVGSVYEIMCYSFVFHAMLMDYDLGWLPSFDSHLVKSQFGASCLWHLELEG